MALVKIVYSVLKERVVDVSEYACVVQENRKCNPSEWSSFPGRDEALKELCTKVDEMDSEVFQMERFSVENL